MQRKSSENLGERFPFDSWLCLESFVSDKEQNLAQFIIFSYLAHAIAL